MAEEDNKTESFDAFGLDPRLVSAIAKMGWETPTKIQAQVIKAAQEGKDVIGTSRTGSGKTAAYLIPVINKLLASLDSVESKDSVMAIVLVPTKELSAQVYDQVQKLLMYASKEVKCVNLIDQAVVFADMNIIVSTPSKLASELSSGQVKVTSDFQSLTIDEADMILSFGYEDDLKKITTFLPPVFQSFLLSATYIPEIDALKQLFLRNPHTIQLEDEHDASFNLVQYWAECKEADKFLLTYFILKLKLITGKCLLFVRDIDRCYQLKLFLEQFGIKSCVLNSELPFNSRYHLVQQFNHGVYEYLIASDEATLTHKQADEKKEDEKEGTIKKDKDYGVSRGIDFQNVGAVINFDFPIHPKAYTHRVGRTARGDNSGTGNLFEVVF
jgi:ATP-dependent RNA helicase DDX56/DBP9